jgi:hypothetical protein
MVEGKSFTPKEKTREHFAALERPETSSRRSGSSSGRSASTLALTLRPGLWSSTDHSPERNMNDVASLLT